MIRISILVLICLSLCACAKPSVNDCKARADAMLDLPFGAFDQGLDGWRSLDGSLGCPDAAREVLARYRQRHRDSLSPANVSLLTWHEAQVWATQGDRSTAVRLMKEAAFAGEPDWQRLYREATISFMEGDLSRLKAARDELASLPRDPMLNGLDGSEVALPPDLDVLDGLISCFGRPYSIAYVCRSAAATAKLSN